VAAVLARHGPPTACSRWPCGSVRHVVGVGRHAGRGSPFGRELVAEHVSLGIRPGFLRPPTRASGPMTLTERFSPVFDVRGTPGAPSHSQPCGPPAPFVTSVVTEEEWSAALDFLTRTRPDVRRKRQELILLSTSSRIHGRDRRQPPTGGPPPSPAVLARSCVEDAPDSRSVPTSPAARPVTPATCLGTVAPSTEPPSPGRARDLAVGRPGNYDAVPRPRHPQGRGRLLHRLGSARYSFWSGPPDAYPSPTTGRSPTSCAPAAAAPCGRPRAHSHFKITPPHHTLITTSSAAADSS